MTNLELFNDWLSKKKWWHIHDNWPEHPVPVKNHQIYFSKHPWMIHPENYPKTEEEEKKDKLKQVIDDNKVSVGSIVSAIKISNGHSLTGKVTKTYKDSKGNSKFSIEFPGWKIDLYQNEIDKGKSAYYGISDINVKSSGSQEEEKYHSSHETTDFEKLPIGTKVFVKFPTSENTEGVITNYSQLESLLEPHGGLYEVSFPDGKKLFAAPADLKSGYLPPPVPSDSPTLIHVVDNSKQLPQKVEPKHVLKPGDNVSALTLQVGDIIEGNNKYEVTSIIPESKSVNIRSLETNKNYLVNDEQLKALYFTLSNKEKFDSKKLIPGQQLTSDSWNHLKSGDRIKYNSKHGPASTYTIISNEKDHLIVSNDISKFKTAIGQGTKNLFSANYSFIEHGDHKSHHHKLSEDKYKYLKFGDILEDSDGEKYAVKSSFKSHDFDKTLGQITLINIKSKEEKVFSSEDLSKLHMSQPTKVNFNPYNLPDGTVFTTFLPNKEDEKVGKIERAEIISTKSDGNYHVQVHQDIPTTEQKSTPLNFIISPKALVRAVITEEKSETSPSEFYDGTDDSSFGNRQIIDVKFPEKPDIVIGTKLSNINKNDRYLLFGKKIKSEAGFTGTVLGYEKPSEMSDLSGDIQVVWDEPDPSVVYNYKYDTANWEVIEPDVDVQINPIDSKFSLDQHVIVNYIGKPSKQINKIVRIGDFNFYNVDGTWVPEENLKLDDSSKKIPMTWPYDTETGIIPKHLSSVTPGTLLEIPAVDSGWWPTQMGGLGSTTGLVKVVSISDEEITVMKPYDLKQAPFKLTSKQLLEAKVHSSQLKPNSIISESTFKLLPPGTIVEFLDFDPPASIHTGNILQDEVVESNIDGGTNFKHIGIKKWPYSAQIISMPKSQEPIKSTQKFPQIDFTKLKIGDVITLKDGEKYTIKSEYNPSGKKYAVEKVGDDKFTKFFFSPEEEEEKITSVDSPNANPIKTSVEYIFVDPNNLEKGTRYLNKQDNQYYEIIKTWKTSSKGGYNYTVKADYDAKYINDAKQHKMHSSMFSGLLSAGAISELIPIHKQGSQPKAFVSVLKPSIGDVFIIDGIESTIIEAPPSFDSTKSKSGDTLNWYDDSIQKFKFKRKDGTIFTKKFYDISEGINSGLWKPLGEVTDLNEVKVGDVIVNPTGRWYVKEKTVDAAGKTKIKIGSYPTGPGGLFYSLGDPKDELKEGTYKPTLQNLIGSKFKIFPSSISTTVSSPVKPPTSTYSPPDVNGVTTENIDWDKRLEKIEGKMGYNPGGKYRDTKTGLEYYIKFPQSEEHHGVEQLATSLYQLASVPVANTESIMLNNKSAIKVSWLPNSVVKSPDELAVSSVGKEEIKKDFVIDAWLANWDVLGGYNSNNIIESNGTFYRIDPGGSMHFKGTGGIKPFGNEVKELDSMKDSSYAPMASKVFSSVTKENLKFGANKLMGITDKHIENAVNNYETKLGTAKKNDLISILISRRNDIVQKILGYQYNPVSKTYNYAPAKISTPQKSEAVKVVQEFGSTATIKVLDRIKASKNDKYKSILEEALKIQWTITGQAKPDRENIFDQIKKFGLANSLDVTAVKSYCDGWQGGGTPAQVRLRAACNELLGVWNDRYGDELFYFTSTKGRSKISPDSFEKHYREGREAAVSFIPYIVASQALLKTKASSTNNLLTVWRGVRGASIRNQVMNSYNAAKDKDPIAMPHGGAAGWSLTRSVALNNAITGVLFRKKIPPEDVLVYFGAFTSGYEYEQEVIIQGHAVSYFTKDELEFPD